MSRGVAKPLPGVVAPASRALAVGYAEQAASTQMPRSTGHGPKGRWAVDVLNTTYLIEFVQSPFSKARQDLIAGLQEFLRVNLPRLAALSA